MKSGRAHCGRVAAELEPAETQWHTAVGALLALAVPDLPTFTLTHGHRGECWCTPELAFTPWELGSWTRWGDWKGEGAVAVAAGLLFYHVDTLQTNQAPLNLLHRTHHKDLQVSTGAPVTRTLAPLPVGTRTHEHG